MTLPTWIARSAWFAWFAWLVLVLLVVIGYVSLGETDKAIHSGVSLFTVLALTFASIRPPATLAWRGGVLMAFIVEAMLLIMAAATQRAALQPDYWDGARQTLLILFTAQRLGER